MSRTISQRELRNESGKIMSALDQGESFVISRHGEPIGELRPLRRPRYVAAHVVVEAFRGAPAVDLDALRADLDAFVDQSIDD